MIQINQLLHAAVLVTDLDRASQFYGEVLGLSQIARSLKYPGVWYQLGELQIHLIVAAAVGTTAVNVEKLGQNRHLAFAVEDLAAAQAQLTAQGYPFQVSASGRAALFVQDPDGNVIELCQPAAG